MEIRSRKREISVPYSYLIYPLPCDIAMATHDIYLLNIVLHPAIRYVWCNGWGRLMLIRINKLDTKGINKAAGRHHKGYNYQQYELESWYIKYLIRRNIQCVSNDDSLQNHVYLLDIILISFHCFSFFFT